MYILTNIIPYPYPNNNDIPYKFIFNDGFIVQPLSNQLKNIPKFSHRFNTHEDILNYICEGYYV